MTVGIGRLLYLLECLPCPLCIFEKLSQQQAKPRLVTGDLKYLICLRHLFFACHPLGHSHVVSGELPVPSVFLG